MAFNKALLREPYWWTELIGVMLMIVAMWLMHTGSARLFMMLIGLGLFIFGAKSLHDNLQRDAHAYELFSRDQKLRTP